MLVLGAIGSVELTLPNFANLKLAKLRIVVLVVGEVINCVLSEMEWLAKL
mgnify:CR=1 FL=1|jgi:hypothetical protein